MYVLPVPVLPTVHLRVARVALLLLALALGFLWARPAHAANITVNTTVDELDVTPDGTCSLREAIQSANTNTAVGGCAAGAGDDIIGFSVNGDFIITLSPGTAEDNNAMGDFDLKSNITFNGNGATNTRISGDNGDRVFDAFQCTCTIILNHLTVQNGRATTTNDSIGGGIFIDNATTFTINSSTITGNQSVNGSGGAIENRGVLTLSNVTLTNNLALGLGGAINSTGVLTVQDSLFTGNQAERGGAIFTNTPSGMVTNILDSVFIGNRTVPTVDGTDDDGGAIAISSDGPVTIRESTFTGNQSANRGGAIFIEDGTGAGTATLNLNFNRIVGNSATSGGSGLFQVSGIANSERNWWGCNAGPTNAACNQIAGPVDADPWIVFSHTASPSVVVPGGASTLTASFLNNSSGAGNSPADLSAFVGVPVSFGSAVLGTLSNIESTIQGDRLANATFTAGASTGNGSATATADGQSATVTILITRPPAGVVSITRSGATPTNAASVSWTVTFNTSVSGVTASNFALAANGLVGTSISGTSGGGTTWTVTANTGSGAGTLGLNLTNDTGLSHTLTNLPFTGEVYTVDLALPDTTINSFPPNPSTSADATFGFFGGDTGTGVSSFQCRIDGSAFAACTSPKAYTGLSDGSHTFQVRALDGAGNVDPTPASYTWAVDTTPPDTTITASPPNPTNSPMASFSFTGSDPGGSGVANFQCQIDGGGFSTCTSPQTYNGMSDGSHTILVRARDAAGNVDPTPATFTWLVDTTVPQVTINQAAGQDDPTDIAPVHFTVVFDEPVTGFVDGDVSLSGTAGATTATITEVAPNDGTTWDVAVNGMTLNGTVIATLGAGVASDAAGNSSTASTSTDNTITFVANHPPVAVADSYQVLEDGTLTVPAPGVLDNDSDVDADSLTAVLVTGAGSGTLTLNTSGAVDYIPTADVNGSDNFTYKAHDARGLESPPVVVSLTITPVNDAPTFTAGGDVFVLEDGGAFSAPWATAISPGPANEGTQSLTFTAVAGTPALFAIQPHIAADGTLTFTPAPDANGSSTVEVTLLDSGGTASGGVDSSTASFQIFILSVADPAVTLTKTVGLSPTSCGTTSDVTAMQGTTLYFCYTVTNTGDIPLTRHSLDTNWRGLIFGDRLHTLAPGASVSNLDLGVPVSQTVSVSSTLVATWTASAELPSEAAAAGLTPQLLAVDTVTTQIAVVQGELVMTLTVGTTAGACAATTEITVAEGTDVFLCLTLSNPGPTPLTTINVTIDGQNATLPGVSLAPGQTVQVTSSQLALLGPITAGSTVTVHTASGTGQAAGVLGAASAQANPATVSPAPLDDPEVEEPLSFVRLMLPIVQR